MDDIEVETIAERTLRDPALIEGLPGVGHVGKLAAEHLVEEFDSELATRVFADEFPPQVGIDEAGVASLACAEFHAVDADGRDLLVLTGDHQAGSNEGHYRLTSTFLDVAESFGATRAFALGGVPTGEFVEEYTVLGAVSDEALSAELREADVEFRTDEPAGGIVGVSGLVLGLGARRGLEAACLMGETSGYLVDPKSARAVLKSLSTLLEFDLAYESLEDRAEEMEEVVGKIREMQDGPAIPDDDLRYIG